MVDTVVALGGFLFTSWAVPEHVNGGGRQKLVTHQLIGGTRIIDVMGWNADQIRLAGRLRGAGAASGARLIETLARTGNPVVFSYWTNRYQVIVDTCRWQFERFYEISYDLALTVLMDLTQDAAGVTTPTLDDAVNADLGSADTIAATLPSADVSLGPVTAAQAAIGTLQGASPAMLLPLTSAVSTALAGAQDLGTSLDAGFPAAAAGGVVGGGDPAVLAASLTSQTAGLQQLAAVTQVAGLLTRVATNLATAPQ